MMKSNLLEIYLYFLQEKEWDGHSDIKSNDLDIISKLILKIGGHEKELNDKSHNIQPTLIGLIANTGGDYKGRTTTANTKRDPRSGFDILKKYLPKNWKELLHKASIKVGHD